MPARRHSLLNLSSSAADASAAPNTAPPPDCTFSDRLAWGLFGFFGSAALVGVVANEVSTYVSEGKEADEQKQQQVQDPLHPSVLSPERIADLAIDLSIAPAFFAALIGPRALTRALRLNTASATLSSIFRVALGTQVLSALTYCGLIVGQSMYEMTKTPPSLTEKMRSELDQRFGNFNPLFEELKRVQNTLSPTDQPLELASLGLRLWLLSSAVTLIATWWVPLISLPATGFFATAVSFRVQRRLKLFP